MRRQKTIEALAEEKKARQNTISVLENIAVGESVSLGKVELQTIKNRVWHYNKGKLIIDKKGFSYDVNKDMEVIIFRRK